ncbi:TonB-dependent receptor [Microscilla marina]|uniref:TonB-dependent receptor n=1 Tax=Microscilla marina TaxID=1027 RepID=UPI0005D47EDD|nr:TonB-dependent receptor [Microscilla marina]
MTKHILFTIFLSLVLATTSVFAQSGKITGKVTLKDGTPVSFANITLANTPMGTASDEKGRFTITNVPYGNYTLKFSAIGYASNSQTISIKSLVNTINIEVAENAEELDEIVVTGTMKAISRKESPVPVEVYSPSYFKKNPTPVLFEALQIVNGVRPQLNCAVCNTGDIHINGMEGPYTMVLIDGMPIVSGLSTVYGLNGIPNSMIERVEVVKGPASTLYGSEAVGGLINVITKTPENVALFSADVMATSWQEYNADLAVKFGKKNATSLLGVNYYNYSNPLDNNGDGFTDITLQNRVSVFNKWNFKRINNRVASIAGRFIYEDRWGGQMNWTPQYRGSDQIYGESIYTARYELMGAYQLPLDSEKIMANFSYSHHDQNSVYGDMWYIAQQQIAFGQLVWDKKISKSHDALFGLALRYTWYDDNTPATRIGDENSGTNKPDEIYLPGIFVQDEIKLGNKHKVLLGARYDYNSEHGSIFTPRFNYKWTPNKNNIFRLSFGNGFRVVNLFTEDHAATTGARDVIVTEALRPERSVNVNLNYQKFIPTSVGVLSLDATAFHTRFSNKIIADYETNDDQIIYDNLDGYAVSQGVSLNLDFAFTFPLKIMAGATLMDVYAMEKNAVGQLERNRQLLTENISGTFAISYTFSRWNLSIDYTGNVYGPMRLPILENDFRNEFSETYSLQNIQITKKFNNGLEIYGGVKNLLNFTPPANSIMRAFDPFDKTADDPVNNPNGYTFDPTYVFAPNQGIRGFFGVRYSIR